MRSSVFLVAGIIALACACSKQVSPTSESGTVAAILNQGPVCAWRITFGKREQGTVVCRYVVTGEDKPREYPVKGDSLVLTAVDQDNILTMVHGSGESGFSSSVTFKIPHPSSGDVRTQGPRAVTVGREETTVWRKSWESPETREEIFSVEVKAFLKTTN